MQGVAPAEKLYKQEIAVIDAKKAVSPSDLKHSLPSSYRQGQRAVAVMWERISWNDASFVRRVYLIREENHTWRRKDS